MPHDFDWLIVGSGFGGSVSALRLAEKGYRVGVIESGRRFADDQFARSAWNLRRYFWMPRLGMRGIMRMTPFKDVLVISGAGVGGGSLGYANTLYRARPAFFDDRQWRGMADWERELAPHYETAERMLGVTDYAGEGPADTLLRRYAESIGVGESFAGTRVGVHFGEPGQTVSDPYFGGQGPDRTGCVRCGSCMTGCRYGAKNTLVKNYLHFAERLGVEVFADRQALGLAPIGAEDGGDGYRIRTERSGAILRRRPRTFTAGAVVLAAGALGTNQLLADCRQSGSLPRISGRLGEVVRTNSESIQAVTATDDSRDFSRTVAITSSIYPDPDTHIEVVSYGRAGDAMSRTFTIMTGDGGRITRPLKWAAAILRRPGAALRLLLRPRHWSRRTVILLVMQSIDSAMRLRARPRRFGGGVRLQSEQDPGRPNPTFIPAAERAARWFEREIGGTAQSNLTESLLNIPTTAHILGGAVIGPGPDTGVVDGRNRVYGYRNLLICDGSAVPANPGVNPSLTITAMAERAMSLIEPAPGRAGTASSPLPAAARAAGTGSGGVSSTKASASPAGSS